MRFSSAITAIAALATVGTVTLMASPAQAQITGLFNTGVAANGTTLLTVGQTDTHYQFITGAATSQAVVTNNAAYLQSPSSGYIFNDAAGSAIGNPLTLQTTFNIAAGSNLSTAQVTGAYSVDNFLVDILINGTSTGINSLSQPIGYTSFKSFTINSGFRTGSNTLSFVVNNTDGPGALNVTNLTGTIQAAAAPEPGSFALVGVALLPCVGIIARRRRNA